MSVRLETEATPEMVRDLQPDALIIAVGADPITPAIPGAEHAIQAIDAYSRLEDMKGTIAVIGGGIIGSEIGLDFAKRGNTVHIIELTDTLNAQGNMLYRIAIRQHMAMYPDLHTMTETQCTQIRPDGIKLVNRDGEQFIAADHIILATGMKPRRALAQSFYGITSETSLIGDCDRVARVLEATNDAYFIGANIE